MADAYELVRVVLDVQAVDVASGVSHSCAADEDGQVWCWGRGQHGKLGDGSGVDVAAVPVRVAQPADVRFVSVAVGAWHTCAVDDAGQVWCWGWADAGRLGHDPQVRALGVPGRATQPDDVQFVDVVAGDDHTCAVDIASTLWCWGANDRGQIGVGTTDDVVVPTAVTGSAVRVSAAAHSTCATVDGQPACWGDNRNLRVGGSADALLSPTAVDTADGAIVPAGPFAVTVTFTSDDG